MLLIKIIEDYVQMIFLYWLKFLQMVALWQKIKVWPKSWWHWFMLFTPKPDS